MTREEFIQILDKKGYSYKIKGDKIIVTEDGNVFLDSLKTIPPGVEFNNGGDVYLDSLIGYYFHEWKDNVEGISPNTLLNGMIKRGIFH